MVDYERRRPISLVPATAASPTTAVSATAAATAGTSATSTSTPTAATRPTAASSTITAAIRSTIATRRTRMTPAFAVEVRLALGLVRKISAPLDHHRTGRNRDVFPFRRLHPAFTFYRRCASVHLGALLLQNRLA